MLTSDIVKDGVKIFQEFQLKVAAIFEEASSLPLIMQEPAIEDIQKRLDQWRAKLHDKRVVTASDKRVLRSRKVENGKNSKAAIRRKDLQEKKATKNRRNARCKKQRLTVVADTDSYKNGASTENGLLSGGHCDDVKDDVPHKRDIKEAANKITKKHLQCETCQKILKTEKGLAEHQEMHKTGPKICPECGKALHSKSSIYVHKKMHKELLKCPHCDYTAAQRSWLRQHVIAVHNKEQKYLCDICAKAFCYESVLKRHIEALHSAGTWIQCEQCDFTTRTGQCLKRHIFNKHTTNAPKWMCDLCGNIFRSKAILEDHRRLHLGEKKFKCTKCNVTFSCRSSKNRHLRTVHGEKQFPCSDCGKLFSEKVYLRRHSVIHTGEKNFTCGFCDYCCNTRGNLRKHWRVVHKKKDHDIRQQRVTRLFASDVDKTEAENTSEGQAKSQVMLQGVLESPEQQYCLTAPSEESILGQVNNNYTITAVPSDTMTASTAQCSFSMLNPVTKVLVTCDQRTTEMLPSPIASSSTEVIISSHHEQELVAVSPHVSTSVQRDGQVLQYTTLQNWSAM